MIQVENLTKSFRDLRRGLVHAVDHVSFDARPGEIFGLLGPNGAGKTTTMRILCTVLRPTGGRRCVAGYDVATQPGEVRQHIGFLSANTAIYDRMSAWELVEYFGRLYGMTGERLARTDGDGLRLPANERLPRHAGGQDEHRHAAEGVDRPRHRPRPAGADLRRADGRPRRAGGPRRAAQHRAAARSWASASCSRRTSCARSSGCATAWPSSAAARS